MGMSDWDAFNAPVPEPKHARTTKRRVSARNPRSTFADHPYVHLDDEGLPRFRVTDPMSAVFAHPEVIEVVEVTYNRTRDEFRGFGHRVLNSGGIAVRESSLTIPARDIPEAVLERIRNP